MSEENNILSVIPRTETERIQISINEYKGKKYLDLRIFYTTDGGDSWLPTKKGISVNAENIELLKDSIEKAMSELSNE